MLSCLVSLSVLLAEADSVMICTPIARADCRDFNLRVAEGMVVTGSAHLPVVDQGDIAQDLALLDFIEERINPKCYTTPTLLATFPADLRKSRRAILLLCLYCSPSVDDSLECVPPLQEMLKSKYVGTRAMAATALSKFRKKAVASVPDLEKAVKDESAVVRLHAAKALWLITQDEKIVLPVLVRELEADRQDVSDFAAKLIGEIGPTARAAVPSLCRSLASKNLLTRTQAAIALGRVSVGSPDVIRALERLEQSLTIKDIVKVLVVSETDAKKTIAYEDRTARSFATTALARLRHI